MQAQTSQQCVVVSFDTYCMNARGKINIYDIPILSCNIPLDNPNLANLVSRQKGFTLGAHPGYDTHHHSFTPNAPAEHRFPSHRHQGTNQVQDSHLC